MSSFAHAEKRTYVRHPDTNPGEKWDRVAEIRQSNEQFKAIVDGCVVHENFGRANVGVRNPASMAVRQRVDHLSAYHSGLLGCLERMSHSNLGHFPVE